MIVLTGISIYIVNFSIFILFVRHMPALATSSINLELILMYLYNGYSNVNTATGSRFGIILQNTFKNCQAKDQPPDNSVSEYNPFFSTRILN